MISVHMLKFRVLTDVQPRVKNGAAAHSTTGVARTSSIHSDARSPSHSRTGRPTMGPIVSTSSGTAAATLTHSRRVKSISS